MSTAQRYKTRFSPIIKLLYSCCCNYFNQFFTGEMIISNDKYEMNESNLSYYSVQMRLTIKRLEKSDLGGYKCISKNSIGDAEGNIRLYGKFYYFLNITL